MRGFGLLLPLVALAMWSCAGGAKGSGAPQVSSHVVTQHKEVCVAASEEEIASLFDRWNNSLRTGDAQKVVADNYAAKSVLLPTLSSKPRFTSSEKEDYFRHFLENGPIGRIESRAIELDCNTAIDDGLYTFTFQKTGTQPEPATPSRTSGTASNG